MTDPRIVLERVSKWHREVLALSEVTLSLGPGIHGLLGPNGAGKSTLLGIVAGVARPSRGTVRVLGGDPAASREVRRRIGFAPHGDAGYEELATDALVALLLRFDGFEEAEARERAARALDLVGLGPVAGRAFGALSRGMRQRVKVAQAIAHEPDVLLLDEPFAGCDPLAKESLREALVAEAARGRTVVVSSHVLHELEPLVDRVVILVGGRVVAQGDLDSLRERSDARRTVRLVVGRPRELAAKLLLDGLADGARVTEDGALEVATRDARGLTDRVGTMLIQGEITLERLESPDDRLEARYHEVLARAAGNAP